MIKQMEMVKANKKAVCDSVSAESPYDIVV